MRNLLQYPVTKDEILEYLKQLQWSVEWEQTKSVGDIRPILLSEAIRIIEENDYEFKI